MLPLFSRQVVPDSLWPHGLQRMPGSSLHPCLLEFAQIHVLWVGDAISPSHPLPPLSPSPDDYTIFHLFSHSARNDWVSDPMREGRRQTSFALLYLEAKETEISLELKQFVVSLPKESGRISPFSVQRDSGWLTTLVCLGLSQFGGKIPWKLAQSWANWKLISHLAGRSGPCWEGVMSRQLCEVDYPIWAWGVNWNGYHMAYDELSASPPGREGETFVIKVNWAPLSWEGFSLWICWQILTNPPSLPF